MIIKFLSSVFHKLLNPHCEECTKCINCEMYKIQLDQVNAQVRFLVEKVVAASHTEIREERVEDERILPIGSKTFSNRRAELERLSRAELIKKSEVLKDLNLSDRPLGLKTSIEMLEDQILGS